MKQRSDEWYLARAGKITGSRFKDILPGKSGKYLKCREDYMFEIVAERLTGESVSKSHGKAGEWGTNVEELAQIMYEVKTGNIAIEAGFSLHPTIALVGVSPDGLIDADGGLEIKCPANSSIHLKTVLTKEMPEEHTAQVQGCMWVTGRKWWDFVSFDPRMPDEFQIYIQRIPRDDNFIATLESEAEAFLEETMEFLNGLSEAA